MASETNSRVSLSSSDDSSSSTSWDTEVESVEESNETFRRPRFFSFDERVRGSLDDNSTFSDDSKVPEDPVSTETVPADQERQLLLLMLLAQVCALHDPTPRTFTVHVLELFERGILDRDSIRFLFDLGLVPSLSPTRLMLPPSGPRSTDLSGTVAESQLAVIEARSMNFKSNTRSLEASAIRTRLENLEGDQQKKPFLRTASDTSSSWSVDAHPLSLSRYKREFTEKRILAAGAFGEVFHVVSKMDGFDYAIKRVPFSAKGFSNDSVADVVREVQCLAVCDHPNVVRYYTSWLEPSWMTGSGKSSVQHGRDPLKLLGATAASSKRSGDSDSMPDNYSKDASVNQYSVSGAGFSVESSFEPSENDWSSGVRNHGRFSDLSEESDIFDRDGSYLSVNRNYDSGYKSKPRERRYSYQICLFIQMQLCHPKSLADWIRLRNSDKKFDSLDSRVGVAADVFQQIVSGLCHVHSKGIIHRDLKPANIFASIGDGLKFKIGDFGLSRLIECVAEVTPAQEDTNQPLLLLAKGEATSQAKANRFTCGEPLTVGIGTVSYASPEQISSQRYGVKADIFSLGLILLELLCCFSTEHERLMTFQNCRRDRHLPDELHEYPEACSIILACTEPHASCRPSASDLRGRNILAKTGDLGRESVTRTLENLQRKVDEQEEELKRCYEEMDKKDRIIDALRQQLQQAQFQK